MVRFRVLARPLALAIAATGIVAPAASAGTAPTKVTGAGTLQVVHADDFVHHRMHMSDELERPGRPNLRVESKRDFMRLDGKAVQARGRLRNGVLTDATAVPDRASPMAAPPVVGPTGAQRVAVLMFNFADNRSQPFTPAQVADTLFTSPTGVNAYYQAASDHQISITG